VLGAGDVSVALAVTSVGGVVPETKLLGFLYEGRFGEAQEPIWPICQPVWSPLTWLAVCGVVLDGTSVLPLEEGIPDGQCALDRLRGRGLAGASGLRSGSSALSLSLAGY